VPGPPLRSLGGTVIWESCRCCVAAQSPKPKRKTPALGRKGRSRSYQRHAQWQWTGTGIGIAFWASRCDCDLREGAKSEPAAGRGAHMKHVAPHEISGPGAPGPKSARPHGGITPSPGAEQRRGQRQWVVSGQGFTSLVGHIKKVCPSCPLIAPIGLPRRAWL
jgi:hypothetical protein